MFMPCPIVNQEAAPPAQIPVKKLRRSDYMVALVLLAIVAFVIAWPFLSFENPSSATDSDGDAMSDAWERQYGLNPNSASDASLDSDGDGYTNLQEYQAGTDPTSLASHPTPQQGLTGYVFADSSRDYRVIGAVVQVQTDNENYSVTTGQSGQYTISGIPAGTWTVTVTVAGETKATNQVAIEFNRYIAKEWNDIVPELVPAGSTDGVSVVYIPSGWGNVQAVSF
jgi:hypothetical protein